MMRTAALLAAALPLLAPAGARAAESRASAALAADEDDPKLQRLADVSERGPDHHTSVGGAAHHAPAIKFAYRHLTVPNLDLSDIGFNAGEVDIYPISLRYVRLGIDAEVGGGSGTLMNQPTGAWYLVAGLNVGFQYPWRVTPFVDGRFVAGLIGGDVTSPGQVAPQIQGAATSWTYMGGVDVGAEVYLVDRLYLSVAIGWVHVTYHGVDLDWAKAHPMDDPRYKDIGGDSFTLKIGLGL